MRILFLGFGGSIALTMHSAWGEFREKYAADTTTPDDETAAGTSADAGTDAGTSADATTPVDLRHRPFDAGMLATADDLDAELAAADAVFVQGPMTPEDINALGTALDRAIEEAHKAGRAFVVSASVPCADPIVDRSTSPRPGITARLQEALRQLTPGGMYHAIRLVQTVLAGAPDPGSLARSRPHGIISLDDDNLLRACGYSVAPADEETSADGDDRPHIVHAPKGVRIGIAASPFQVASHDTLAVSYIAKLVESSGATAIVWAGDPTDVPDSVEPPPDVDAWMNLTGFTLAGTHANPRVDNGVEFLTDSGVPMITPVPLLRMALDRWQTSDLPGLTAGQVSMNIAIPEFESGLAPWVIGGRGIPAVETDDPDHPVDPRLAVERMLPDPYMCALVVNRTIRTVVLHRLPAEQRKLSITIFGHDADGTIGTAAHLDVFRSLWNFLHHLRAEGYTVEIPKSPEALVDNLFDSDAGNRSTCHVAATWSATEYNEALTSSQVSRIDRLWTRTPGMIDTDGRELFIRGVRLGNVFIGVQPDFGDVADPLNVLMAPEASPSHSFAAYYLWLEHEFSHDVMLHWGTHGALEFMPGRSTGLIRDDWPLLLTDSVPHSYLYAMSNPAEGTIAKRRSFAGLVSYLTPQLIDAGLHGALAAAAEEAFRLLTSAKDGSVELNADACSELVTLAAEADLTDCPPPNSGDEANDEPGDDDGPHNPWQEWVSNVSATAERIRRTPIPEGLHTLGEPLSHDKTARILSLACTYPLATSDPLADDLDEEHITEAVDAVVNDDFARFTSLVAGAFDNDAEATNGSESANGSEATTATPTSWFRHLRRLHSLLTSSQETDGLLTSLSGGYVPPAPGGEPASRPESLPTGRNTHGADPATMPTPTAARRGAATADALVESLRHDNGHYPESIAMVIWGMDNVKTNGEGIAQAFHLIGAEPLTDERGRVSRFRIIPLEELGRPRVDVVCTMSGVGRDLLAGPMELLDDAIHAVASLSEEPEDNPIRAHAMQQAEELGLDLNSAATRIYATAPGNYGTGVNKLVQSSEWDDNSDLAEVYLHRMGHAWGKHVKGTESRALLESSLSRVSATFQNVDSTEISLAGVDHYFEFLGGVSSVVETVSGARPSAKVSHAWQHETNVESLDDAMRLESRTRLLNPAWYEAQLKHGYQGVANIRSRFENTFGMQATARVVDNWVFDRTASTFITDDDMRERLAEHNPAAVLSMTERLLEAADRGLWETDDDVLDQLEDVSDSLDATVEGVTPMSSTRH